MTGGVPSGRRTGNGPATPLRPRSNRPRSFRDRRTLLGGLVAGMLVGLLLLAWTGLQSHATASAALTATPAGSGAPAVAASGAPTRSGTLQAVGRITAVATATAPTGTKFTLQTVAGQTMQLELEPGTDAGVPSGWLAQREAADTLVRVTYHIAGGSDVVDRLAGALGSAPPSTGAAASTPVPAASGSSAP